MDPMVEEQLDYEDDDYAAGGGGGQKHHYAGGQKHHYAGGGAISALAEEELVGDDDYDDLYSDVNVSEDFMKSVHHHHQQNLPPSNPGPIPSHFPPSAHGLTAANDPSSSATAGAGFRASETAGTGVNIPGVGYLDGKISNAGGDFVSSGGNDYAGSKARLSEIPVDPTAGKPAYRESAPAGRGMGAGVPEQGGNMAGGGVISMPAPRSVNQSAGIFASRPPLQSLTQQQPQQVQPHQMQQQQVQQQQMQQQQVQQQQMQPMVESNGNTMLFVGELHWWTTDAELESELSRYGKIKEIKFFDERASGKSKGYCQVEFFDAGSAGACKEGMNGHVFNGRACVVVFATQQNLKQMGAAYANKTQTQTHSQMQGRRGSNNDGNRNGGMNFQGGVGGRMGWGRGGQGMQNRGQNGGNIQNRNRGNMGVTGAGNGGITGSGGVGKGMMANAFVGPPIAGPPGALMQQGLMGPGFDPTYISHMGRGSMYGGFPAPTFPGMMPTFPPVNSAVGLPGVAPHVNPAFFVRGMAANGMGMMGSTGMDGHAAGMWTDPAMGGWPSEEHGRTRDSSYGDDGTSDYAYGESNDRGGRPGNASREKERGGSERDWSGNSDRRHRDEREADWYRHRYRDEKEGYSDQRHRERDYANEEDWDRGRTSTSGSRSKSRMQEEDQRSRSKDVDYGKRRRLPSE